MQITTLLLHSPGARSPGSREVPPCRIALQGYPQAPPHEVAEWTPQGIGRVVVHIPVSPGKCLAKRGHMSRPNSSVSHPERDESLMANCASRPPIGRRPIETCVIA